MWRGAPEVGLVIWFLLSGLVLVFACARHSVAGAVGDDIDAAPVGEALGEDCFDGGADADVAESGEIGGGVLSLLVRRGRDVVWRLAVARSLCPRTALTILACGPEDLAIEWSVAF